MLQSAPNYVFDASSLIDIERSEDSNKGLRKMPEPPGKWLIIPSKVAKQVNGKDAPTTTKKWISSGHLMGLTGEWENTTFMTLRVREPLLEDPDVQGIVIAASRGATYVVENGRAKIVARSIGVRCISFTEFFEEVQPRMF